MNKRELIYEGKVVDLYKDTVTLPNGHTTELDFIKHPGASAVVPITDDGRFVMMKQYRHAAGGYLFEIPAGKLDVEGEDPLACAKRELEEETGYKADEWKHLVSIKTTPGFTDEVIHIYLARGLTEGESNLEESEIIELHHFSREEVEKMLDAGEIVDAKTLVGLYAALRV